MTDKLQAYAIYDGRAIFDLDSATILEVFDAMNDQKAEAYLREGYQGASAALFDQQENCIAVVVE